VVSPPTQHEEKVKAVVLKRLPAWRVLKLLHTHTK